MASSVPCPPIHAGMCGQVVRQVWSTGIRHEAELNGSVRIYFPLSPMNLLTRLKNATCVFTPMSQIHSIVFEKKVIVSKHYVIIEFDLNSEDNVNCQVCVLYSDIFHTIK